MAKFLIELPDEVDQALDRLATDNHVKKVDVIRQALALYKYVMEKADGSDVQLSIRKDTPAGASEELATVSLR